MKTLLTLLPLISVLTAQAQNIEPNFTLKGKDTFTDPRDNKTYKTVKIGEQTWMAENLAYEIPGKQITDGTTWAINHVYDAWCYYYNDKTAYADKYGILYQWEAAKKACPDGWHLPSDAEWKQLETHLGMSRPEANDTGFRGTNEGNKLKATNGWEANGNGTNESGFTAVPGGYRYATGTFNLIGNYGYWWGSSESSATHAYTRRLNYDYSNVYRNYYYKGCGFSVRCLRDF